MGADVHGHAVSASANTAGWTVANVQLECKGVQLFDVAVIVAGCQGPDVSYSTISEGWSRGMRPSIWHHHSCLGRNIGASEIRLFGLVRYCGDAVFGSVCYC